MSVHLQTTEPLAVLISCYNNWTSLERGLVSLEAQTDRRFVVFLADDGSGPAFVEQLRSWRAGSALEVEHIWHEDIDFRKAEILNKAARAAECRYLLFLDGDMVVRRDWVAAHRALARPRRYMTGGSHINIPAALQEALTAEDIRQQRLFDWRWLREKGIPEIRRYRRRLASHGFRARLLDFLTPRRDSFVGCNSGCWREDFFTVGGFDQTFVYGGVDRDLGIRMANVGVRGTRHRYSLAAVHLDHPRPWRDPERVRRQKAALKKRKRDHQVRPDHELIGK